LLLIRAAYLIKHVTTEHHKPLRYTQT